MIWLIALAAAGVAMLVTRLMIPLAHRIGAVDHPEPIFQTHLVSTPLLGGVGIVAGWAVGALFPAGILSPGFLLGAALLVLLGAYKDIRRHDLPVGIQLLVQALACALAAELGTASLLADFVTIFAGVVLINAVNFLDVMDALCASVCAVAALGLWLLTSSPSALALAAALGGFLLWNRPPARIFMGDLGSYFIGYLLFRIALLGLANGVKAPWLVLALAVPFFEVIATVATRILSRRSPLRGDTSHVSLALARRGMSRQHVVLAFSLAGAVCAALAVLLAHRISVA